MSLIRALTKNIGTLILAIVLSTAIWVVATVDENPEQAGNFVVPVETTVIGEGLLLYSVTPTEIVIQVSAPKDVWSSLSASSFKATANLQKVTAGLHEVEVQVESSDRRARVMKKTPDRVTVRLEWWREKVLPVVVRVSGSPAPGYFQESPFLSPRDVTIRGAESVIQPAVMATVDLRLDGDKMGLRGSFAPVPRNARGEEIKGVNIEPASILVELPLKPLSNYKTVSIKAVITGTVAPGYWVSNITVEPSTITFGGDPKELDFAYVETAPVNVSGAVTDVIRSVPYYIPPGTAPESKAKPEVFVKVSVEPIPGEQYIRRPVLWRNLTTGLTVTLGVAVVEITLDGDLATLQRLQPTEAQVWVDLKGVVTGTHELPIILENLPTGLRVVNLRPARIPVIIK